MSDAIRIRGLAKTYGGLLVLGGFDLTVRRGEILVLLGPSGCGKTTVLRLIAGLEVPDAGTIEVDGQAVSGPGVMVPPERRRVGMVFQEYALFPHLTVAQNIAYGLTRGTEDPSRVTELLEVVGLRGLEDRMAYELSGGQQQRVALARAMAREPLVVLLDEPFSNLDADLRQQLREEMREILQRTHTTAVFVTHDQEEALQIGDQVAVLNRGSVEQIGTPEEIYQQPRTRFIATFLGRADFLSATVTRDGLLTEIGRIAQRVPLAEGTAVDVLVRADDVALASGDGGTVISRLFKGMQNVYRVKLRSGRVVQSLQDHTVRYAIGSSVRVIVDPGHPLVCFPNGEAILAEMVPDPDPAR